MKFALVITAAGKGLRFGAPVPKQFCEIDGVPVLIKTCLVFAELPEINECVITVHLDYLTHTQELLEQYGLSNRFKLQVGGDTRFESVKNGVEALPDDVEYVLIHDAARPFLTQELLKRLLKGVVGHDVLIPVMPITDTIKRVEHGMVIETVNRDEYVTVQTPQVFRKRVLQAAYNEVKNSVGFTDEAMLMEAYGVSVNTIFGEVNNIKITYMSDI